ncbi:MAG TPA: hypothetical protein VLF19_06940 [Methylomirabilota bacterium]|nr:hypothetical protein [Methylomirabilota bacterium]
MPYGEPDPGDPSVLVGVTLPAGAEAVRDMAWVFAEEFARLGYDARRILGLFRSPFYAGAHHALRALGETEVAAIIEECVSAWRRPPRGDATPPGGGGRPPQGD